MKKFFKILASYIIYGFVFWLPLIVAVIIAAFIFDSVENFGENFMISFFPKLPFYTGLTTLFFLFILFLTGIILRKTTINKLFSKIPVLGLFFGEGRIMTFEKLSSLTPCIFQFSPTCLSYGWVISEEKVQLDGQENGLGLLNIYYPNVPTLITGQIYIARKETVMKLGNSSKEIIDLLLYALKRPEHLKYLPWPGESAEDFQKRAENFGLNIITG